jgi:hypothetical protein
VGDKSFRGDGQALAFEVTVQKGVAMGTYEVTCATRADCDHGGHVTNVSMSRKKETEYVDISVVRLMLSSGDTVYVRDSANGDRIGLRKGRCDCGVKTIRTDVKDSGALAELPPCP